MADNHEDDRTIAWREYLTTGSNKAADRLLTLYRHLIDPYVNSAYRRAPITVSKEEIEAAALIGLYQAIIAHSQDKGANFEVYAPWRIRGAIVDELRALDPLGQERLRIVSLGASEKTNLIDSHEPTPDAALLGGSGYEHILRSLPPDIAEFLDLIFNENISIKGLAARNNTTEAQVTYIKNEVLKAIRKAFKDENGLFKNSTKDQQKTFIRLINDVRAVLGKPTSQPMECLGLCADRYELSTNP